MDSQESGRQQKHLRVQLNPQFWFNINKQDGVKSSLTFYLIGSICFPTDFGQVPKYNY